MMALATYEETAAALGLTTTTVRNLERRALAKLRRHPDVIAAARLNGLLSDRDAPTARERQTTNWERFQ